MTEALFAMISSSTLDLGAHRAAALDACLRQRVLPRMMEHEPAADRDASRLSVDLVDECDVYVLVLGFRYGSTPPGAERSYTHLEYERARATGKVCIVLLMSDEHDVKPRDVERGPGAEKLALLREEVAGERVVQYFSSPEDMRAKLITELARLREAPPVQRNGRTTAVLREPSPPDPFRAQPYSLLDPDELVGRRAELETLDGWVGDPASHRVVVLTAIGGMGKSALAWKWFQKLVPSATVAGRVWWSFYEEDAHFDAFVLRTLAYVSGVPSADLQSVPAPERIDRLLDILDREPHVVVLDGLERLLLAYSRPDAASVSDASVETAAAQALAEVEGLITSTGSFTGNARLRTATDPRVGSFLRRIAGLRAGRVLITSRLYPRELQRPTGIPVPGSTSLVLGGLSDAEALRVWADAGCSGERGELIALFRSFGNYPLLIRALAAEVAGFRPAPGDYSAWRSVHSGFDPFRTDLLTPDDRRSHVLRYSLNGLADVDRQVLQVAAAITGPVTYPTLCPLVLAPHGPISDEAGLDIVLTGLEDRGLLGWDRSTGRYEMHPVVRGIAMAGVDEAAQKKIYERLAAHFGSLPEADVNGARTIDDLETPVRLANLYVKLDNLDLGIAAAQALFDPLIRLRAFDTLIELFETLEGHPDWDEHRKSRGKPRGKWVSRILIAWTTYMSGDPIRSMQSLDVLDWTHPGEMIGVIPYLRCGILAVMGRLGEAQRQARLSITETSDPGSRALGAVLMRMGETTEAHRWLIHHEVEHDAREAPTGHYEELGLEAVHRSDAATVMACAVLAHRATPHPVESAVPLALHAAWLRITGRDVDDARRVLDEGLLDARSARFVGGEIDIRIESARLHLQCGQIEMAREEAHEAIALAQRCGFRLQLADAQLALTEVELAGQDASAAAEAAEAAFRSAWCDGGRHVYRRVLDRAAEHLLALGVPPPDDLPVVPPPPMPPLTMQPRSFAEHFRGLAAEVEPDPAALRAAVARARFAPPDPALARTLIELSASMTGQVRAAALEALGVVLPPVDDLAARGAAGAADIDPDVRQAAVTVLTEVRDTGRLGNLVRADPEPQVRAVALAALMRLDVAAVHLAEFIEQPEARADALAVAAADPHFDPTDVLRRHLGHDPNGDVRALSGALLLRRAPQYEPHVREVACSHPDETVRGYLVAALVGGNLDIFSRWKEHLRNAYWTGAIDDPAAVAFLTERAASDPSPAVRVFAATLQGVAARPHLVRALLSEQDAAMADLLVGGITIVGGPGDIDHAELAGVLSVGLAPDTACRVMHWLVADGRGPGISAVETQLVAADVEMRRAALEALASTRPELDRRLLTVELDGQRPYLDPLDPQVDDARIEAAAAATGIDADRIRDRYGELLPDRGSG